MTHQRRSLFGEGARLPEELSRLLFLEPVIEGRRVLEVGARSDAVARFLIQLGAARVVCASEDRDLVEMLRAENDLDKVDFRAIRPGVLPGDDGAFDLVIDFTLPEALAAGHTFRLTDMGRLLSEDGFAVTALKSTDARGLATLLGGATATPVVTSHASAGLARGGGSGEGAVVTYRGLVEALKLQFDLVQVYFQSLLLGYLFGSFDVEPSDGGVSPNTALMGETPEPAGHYLFAFGRAVPVVEDVALVQVPFSDLLDVVAHAGRSATHLPAPAAHAAPAEPLADGALADGTPADQPTDEARDDVTRRDGRNPRARRREVADGNAGGEPRTDEGAPVDERLHVETVPTGEAPAIAAAAFVGGLAGPDAGMIEAGMIEAVAAARDVELGQLREQLVETHTQIVARDDALAELGSRLVRLKGDAEVLVAEVERRTAERDELAVFLEGTDAAVAARDALIASLRAELEGGGARMRELEDAARAGSSLAESARMLVVEHESLKEERRRLVEAIATLEGERVAHEGRVRVLEEAHELSILRVGELEDALLSLESQRGQLAADLARVDGERAEDAERMNRERGAERQLLEAALANHQLQVRTLERDIEDARSQLHALHRAKAQQGEAESQEAQRARLVEERAAELEAQLAAFVNDLEARKGDIDALTARVEELEQALALAERAAHDALASRDRELAELTARREELEDDARRLAEGVKTLVHEREENRARADETEARLGETERRLGQMVADERTRAEQAEERVGTLVVGYDQKQAELAEMRDRFEQHAARVLELEELGEASQRKLRAAHAALEEARRDLLGARESFQEIAGQRDTLNQVVSSRERELITTKDELLQATAEVNRLREQVDAQSKALAEARQRVQSVEVDRATQKRREEEIGRAHQDATSALVDANDKLARLGAELDGARARIGELEAQATRDGAELAGAREELGRAHEELARTRSELGTTAESLDAQLRALRGEASDAQQRADGLAGELASARAEEERLRAELHSAHDDTVRLEAENARTIAEQARAAADLERAHAELARANAELASLSEEANRTLAAADDDRGRFARNLEGTQAELARVRGELADAAQESAARAEGERAARGEAAEARDETRRALEEARAAFDAERALMQEALAAEMQARESEQRAASSLASQSERQAAARIGVLEGALSEAQLALDHHKANSELLRASLGEARSLLEVERARGDLFGEELEEAHQSLSHERARGDLFASTLSEAHSSLVRERARGDLFASQVKEASLSLSRERARGDLFASQLDEAHATLQSERARGDLFAADLGEAQEHIWALRERARGIVAQVHARESAAFEQRGARAALSEGVLAEAQARLAQEKARADLLAAQLEEAQGAMNAAVTYASLLHSELDDARDTYRKRKDAYEAIVETERIRAAAAINDSDRASQRAESLTRAVADAETRAADERMHLEHDATQAAARADDERARAEDAAARADQEQARADEAAMRVDQERARAEEESARAEEAAARAEQERGRTAQESARADEGAARAAAAEDALRRVDNDLRKALHDAEERMRATGRAITGLELELKDLKEKLAERQSDDMLVQAERERLTATVESAERERDALLGDLSSHQARANNEAARRLAVEDELHKLRLAHNQSATEAQRLKQELEVLKRTPAPVSPALEAEVAALKERLEAAEKASALKDAKITEQADRINRLTERLVREAGMA